MTSVSHDSLTASGEFEPDFVKAVLRTLTRAERHFVDFGCIHGSFSMSTVNNLKGKGLFYLHIDSPNGRCGFMKLTALGLACQALIKERAAKRAKALDTGASR